MVETFLNALSQGSAVAVLVAFVAGLLSVATPCVLPMVSITLGVLGVTKAASRGRAVLTSLCYAAGIVATFTALGVVSGLTGGLFGSWLGHPAAAIAIAAVFLVLAANAFELFEIRLPQPLLKLLSRSGGPGLPGAFLAGLGAGFIASPCVGPVLFGILTYVAATKAAVTGALLLAAYGAGFGLPYVIVGAFALRLPVRGALLRGVKSFFGLILILGAFWFLRGVFPVLGRPHGLILGLALLAAGLLAGALHKHFDGDWQDRGLKAAGIVIAAAGGVFLINAAVCRPASVEWCHETPSNACLARVVPAHDLTVAVFGAEWCPWCQKLKNATLADPQVAERLRGLGLVMVDTDANGALSEKHGIRGIPAVKFFDRQGKELPGGFEGYVDADEFLKTLDAVEQARCPDPPVKSNLISDPCRRARTNNE